MIRSVLSVCVPLIIGFALVRLSWRGAGRSRADLCLQLALSVGAGFGIFSVFYFIWLLILNTRSGFLVANLAIVAGLIALRVRRARPGQDASVHKRTPAPFRRRIAEGLLFISFFISCLSAMAAFFFASLKSPHGGWDAWASWNMRARFLYRGNEQWSAVFSKVLWYSGADYPLLLPASVAGCWALAGSDSQAVPVTISLLFTFAIVGLAASSIATIRGTMHGYVAGLAILLSPAFVQRGTSQYADTPLSYFFMATFALLHLCEQSEEKGKLLILAGAMAGLAAWTKNEGLLFIIAIIAGRLAVAIPTRRLKDCLKQLFTLAKGFMPFVLIIMFLKLVLAEPNPIVASQQGQTVLEKLTDPSRYEVIYRSFIDNLAAFGRGGSVASIWIILAIYLALAGVSVDRKERPGVAASLLTLLLMMAGYFAVYLVTPFELGWHLLTTLDRLLVQLWPSFVFLVFLIARPLDQLASKKEDAGVNPEPVAR